MSFSGFPSETQTFFSNLISNNTREWFSTHKVEYEALVLNPARDFVREFGEALETVQPGIQYDTRSNGSGSFFRIHRDTRFSKDKTPYKSSLSAMLWVGDNLKKMENPGYYIRIDEHGVDLYAGMYGMSKDMLASYRNKVDDAETGALLAKLLDALAAANYDILGERYKRIPVGFDKSHPRATLLLNKGLFVKAPAASRQQLASSELLDWAITHAKKMAPLNQWFAELTEGSQC